MSSEPGIFSDDLVLQATALVLRLRARNLKLALAESCTAGALAACITDVPGASEIFERGFVAYANGAKTELLDVPGYMIAHHGAVSAVVAEAMAEGALDHSDADLALSITGIAGPDGGSADKPVGLVYFGVKRRWGKVRHERHVFAGGRAEVRLSAIKAGLAILAAAAP